MPYMVEHNGSVVGPFAIDELSSKVALGILAPNDLACNQDSLQWLPLSQLVAAQPVAPAITSKRSVDQIASTHKSGGAPMFKLVLAILGSAFFIWRMLVVVHRLSTHLAPPQ